MARPSVLSNKYSHPSITCRGVSGFATGFPCSVWSRGLTTCPLWGSQFWQVFKSVIYEFDIIEVINLNLLAWLIYISSAVFIFGATLQ